MEQVSKDDKVLIFSPHPDDDVIGMGGMMQKLNRDNVTLVYMTDGSGGYDKTRYHYNPRLHEAYRAVNVLGYTKENICIPRFPFYIMKSEPGVYDYSMAKNIIDSTKPNHIFVCGDSDPNKTHDKCFKIVNSGIELVKQSGKYTDKIHVWAYNSVWGVWSEKDETSSVVISKEEYRLKIESILKHESQNPPMVAGEDPRPFHVRIEEKNRNGEQYEERFKLLYIVNSTN